MKIQEVELLPAHIGAAVVYKDRGTIGAIPEKGKIVRWNTTYVFILFDGQFQPKACSPEFLTWYEGDEENGYPHNQDKDLVVNEGKFQIRVVGPEDDSEIRFTIDHQSFTLKGIELTKEEAIWHSEQLATALKRLTHHHKPGRIQITLSYIIATIVSVYMLHAGNMGWGEVMPIFIGLIIKDLIMAVRLSKKVEKSSTTYRIRNYDD